ncbi:cholinesterase 1-like [Oppia nitens]|uniref:cholinesterase 1-like n=1 Tax=Oppia nitens TaxID=1686743 RepID=UPI0023DC4317|nr:cholinesterase 1-like [Oppia nitens]
MANIIINSFTLILLTLIVIVLNDESVVQIKVKPKLFNGLTKQIDGKTIGIYLGIPYAKPPIGELRFKKPVPIREYNQPVNATQWANPCQQSPALMATVFKSGINNTNFSEDCLYLNVWTPPTNITTTDPLKPVLVWIHGGGFYAGSANSEQTTGDVLAAKMDVIVVSFNYRLGWFGFLYSGTDEAPGNVGLWDQALALKWINENIYYFGGDPERITIIGEGSGSISVALHILSPITRNLFNSAVMISGGPVSDVFMHKDVAREMWANITIDFGCDQSFVINGSVDCLHETNAQKLIESTFDKRYKLDVNIVKPFLIYGDQFLPKSPSEMLNSGDFKRNVNLLIGTTDDEGSNILSTTVDTKKYSIVSPQNLTKSEAKLELKNIFRRFFPHLYVSADDIYRLYISHIPENDFSLIRQGIGRALGDYITTCPALLFAKQLASIGTINSTHVYQYKWSVKYESQSWHGSDYGLDLSLMFGEPYRHHLPNGVNDPQKLNEKRTSLKIMEVLAHFARFGNPGPQDGIQWQSYYTVGDNVLINPYFEFTKRYFIGSDFGIGYKYECNQLWSQYVLKI